jgi:hypothetical protein
MSRLVLNHTTHIPGLIPALTRMAEHLGSGRIVPGVISRTRGRAETFSIRLSNGPDTTGPGDSDRAQPHKLVARKGKTIQEVLVISPLSRREIENALRLALKR